MMSHLALHTNYRTYIPEPAQPNGRNWKKRIKHERKAIEANRRRMKGRKGKKLQRLRSEKVERTFAHVLETGGARRTYLRGTEKVQKRHLIATAAHNHGVLMRLLFEIGTARSLQGMAKAVLAVILPFHSIQNLTKLRDNRLRGLCKNLSELNMQNRRLMGSKAHCSEIYICSTGCLLRMECAWIGNLELVNNESQDRHRFRYCM